MSQKFVSNLWHSALLVFFMSCILTGCGSQRWSPTDPRTDALETSNIIVDATWEMDITADVDNN